MPGCGVVGVGAGMRIDQLDVVLRARSGWEAVELGTALVRRHARAIWAPILLLGLPVFALVNALAWWPMHSAGRGC